MNGVPRDHIHGGRHVERELSRYLEPWVGLDEGHILQWVAYHVFVLLAQIGSSANTILSSSISHERATGPAEIDDVLRPGSG
jgi:hypothetical protein